MWLRIAIAIVVIAVVVYLFVKWAERDPCPRTHLGYSCHGKDCDHSAEAWSHVRRAGL